MHELLNTQLEDIISNNGDIVVIPGLGGHSGASVSKVLNQNSEINFVLIFNAFDDGGDTGKVNAALKTPAMGDLRNTLVHLWEASENDLLVELSKLFNKRVGNFVELLEQAKLALECMQKISVSSEFNKIAIEKYIKEFEERCKGIDPSYLYDGNELVDHNVGNIVLSALFTELGGLNEVIYKLKEANIINKNIYCVSMADNASVELMGIDEDGNILRREKIIDNHTKKIGLKTLNCVIPQTNPPENYTQKNEFIQEVMRRAQAIIWPASSPNNWSVITRMYQQEIAWAFNRPENPAIGICWAPVTQEKNSFGIMDIILFLYEMFGDNVNFLIPEAPQKLIKEHFIEYTNMVKAYEQEGKVLQLYDLNLLARQFSEVAQRFYANFKFNSKELFDNNIHPVSGAVMITYSYLESEGKEIDIPLTQEQSELHARMVQSNRGIKHSPEFMSKFIQLLVRNNWEINNELLEEAQREVDVLFNRVQNGEAKEVNIKPDSKDELAVK